MKRLLSIVSALMLLVAVPASADTGLITLPEMVSTSSPSSAITQRVFGKALKITGLTTGQCLTLNGSSILTTTTCGSSGGDTNWAFSGGYLAPTTTVGVIVSASSTIGSGTQTGGLTISGGATTTLNHYFVASIGIGTTTPIALLSVANSASTPANTPLLAISSTTGGISTSTIFQIYANGTVQIGSTTPAATSKLAITGATADTGVIITGVTSGTGISANTVTSGVAFSATGISTGSGLSAGNITTGKAVNCTYNTGVSTGSCILSSAASNMTGDYTGAGLVLNGSPTRNVAAAAARTNSGNIVSIIPSYTTSGALVSTLAVSGTSTVIGRVLSNASSGVGSSITATAPVLEVSNRLTATAGVTDTSNLMSLLQMATTSTGTVFTLNNAGTGNLATFTGNGNFGIGTTSPMSTLSVVGTSTFVGRLAHFGTTSCGTGGLYQYSLQGIEYCGDDNSDTGGVQILADNGNAGPNAWVGFNLNNNLADNTFTHFGGLYLNSSTYNSTAFGTAYPVPNQLMLQNTDGPLVFITGTTTNNGLSNLYMAWVVGSGNQVDEKMRLTTTGRLGIGTTSPVAKLEVNGNIFGGNLIATGTLVVAGNATHTGTLAQTGASTFTGLATLNGGFIAASSTINGVFTATGNGIFNSNVGIGTTTPSRVLDVTTGSSVSNVRFQATGQATPDALTLESFGNGALDRGPGLLFNVPVAASPALNGGRIFVREEVNTGTAYMAFQTGVTGTLSEKLRITSAGNIGVGTTTPFAKFSIAGSAGGTAPLLAISSSTAAFATSTALLMDSSGLLTLGSLKSGGTSCVQADANGLLSVTGSACGGSSASSTLLTDSNTFSGLKNTITNASTTNFTASYASSTLGVFGTLTLPPLGTGAGSYLAVNPSGQVIATTTPSSGGTSSSIRATTTLSTVTIGSTNASTSLVIPAGYTAMIWVNGNFMTNNTNSDQNLALKMGGITVETMLLSQQAGTNRNFPFSMTYATSTATSTVFTVADDLGFLQNIYLTTLLVPNSVKI
jgi:hypothetical protein